MKYALATMCLLASLSAGAQSLVDPMRPPLGSPGDIQPQRAGRTVQMIVIGPERRYAVIDGQLVMPGDRIGEARVVSIAETEVTVRGAGGDTVLRLLPQVSKKAAASDTMAQTKGEKGKR